MDLSIIIPAYNEQETIEELINRIKDQYPSAEIIVIDDASSDNTAQISKKAGAKLISHPYRMGNGAAVKTGLRESSGDIIVMLDADLQHPPEEIPALLEHMDSYDMVVGARTAKSKVSLFRTVGNIILKKTAEILSRNKISDLTSGFRAVRRTVAMEFIHLLPNGFSYPTTLTIALFKSGYFVKYHDIPSIKKREHGKSKITPFRNGFEFMLLIMRIIMLFDPMRIFIPVSLFCLASGTVFAVYQIITLESVEGASVILLLSGLFIFLFGLLADQNASIRREYRSKNRD